MGVVVACLFGGCLLVLAAGFLIETVESRKHDEAVRRRVAAGDRWMTPTELTRALAEMGMVQTFLGMPVPVDVGMWRRDYEEMADLISAIPFKNGREVYVMSFLEERAANRSWKVA